MEITAKDILSDENLRILLCEAIAKELVEKNFFENVAKYDDYGCERGFDECLKPELLNLIRKTARDVAVEEAKKILADDYDIKRSIRETIKSYIVSQFEEMVKNANK